MEYLKQRFENKLSTNRAFVHWRFFIDFALGAFALSLFTAYLANGVHVTIGEWIAMIVTILVGSLLIGIVEESG